MQPFSPSRVKKDLEFCSYLLTLVDVDDDLIHTWAFVNNSGALSGNKRNTKACSQHDTSSLSVLQNWFTVHTSNQNQRHRIKIKHYVTTHFSCGNFIHSRMQQRPQRARKSNKQRSSSHTTLNRGKVSHSDTLVLSIQVAWPP
ncbi:hypothetical protein AKJ16_DCAP07086 [Drosera capensis]